MAKKKMATKRIEYIVINDKGEAEIHDNEAEALKDVMDLVKGGTGVDNIQVYKGVEVGIKTNTIFE